MSGSKRERTSSDVAVSSSAAASDELATLLASGAYIPPFKLARLMAAAPPGPGGSAARQALTWEALKVRGRTLRFVARATFCSR